MNKRIFRILAGLLCLFLLVGMMPMDLLGDLLPKADAAAITFKTTEEWGYQRSFNGLFILRSSTDPSLVLTSAKNSYTGNDLLSFQKLGAVGDIRRQMFVFRTAHNHQGANGIDNAATVYFRPLYEVYRYEESTWQHGNLWVQSSVAAGKTPSIWSVKINTDASGNIVRTPDGLPENTNQGDFGWHLNVYQYSSNYKGFLKAGIYENSSSGDGNTSVRYITQTTQTGSGLALYYNDDINQDIMNTSFIFEPCSYDVDDSRNVNLHTSLGETSQYMRAMNGFVANSNEITYGPNDVQPYYYGWTLTALNNGYHAITSIQHDRYLALSNNKILTLGNQAHNESNQWSYPQDAEQWQFVPYYDTDQGFTYLIVNKATGYILMRSASSNYVIADSYYATNEQNNRWMVTYPTDSYYTDRGYAHQTGYSPAVYSHETEGIRYPLSLKTGSSTGTAYSKYHTLKLNPASTVVGHFDSADIALDNNMLESRFVSTSGYLFDTRMVTSGTPSYWDSGVSYGANSVIENNTNQYRATMNATGNPPYGFKPVGSSSFSATIQFQFKYTSGMFMRFFGGNNGFHVQIRSTDYSTTYYDNNWVSDTAKDVTFSNMTANEVYTMTITKDSHSDGTSHFYIFTNIKPIVVHNELDDNDKTKLFDVGANVYQDGKKLALNGAAVIGKPLEYGFTITNKSAYNLFVQSFSSPTMTTDRPEETARWGVRNLGGFAVTMTGELTPGLAVDSAGNIISLDDLVFSVFDDNGNLVKKLTNPTTSSLANFLIYVPSDSAGNTTYGLPYGWTIEVRGIYYRPSNADLEIYARKMVVPYVTAMFHAPGALNDAIGKWGENTSIHFTNEPFFVQWAGQPITISKELLFELIQKAGKHKYEIEMDGLAADNIKGLYITDNQGNIYNTTDVVTNGTNMVLQHADAGRYQYNVKVNFKNTFAFVPFQVFVYDVSDDVTFVLDYGLPVELDKESYTDASDFNQPYNKLEIGTPFETTIAIQQITATKPTHDGTYLTVTEDLTTTYGRISIDANNKITYTPTAFLNGADTFYVVFKVSRSGSTAKLGVSVADEVLMYKTITILPSNVIYYEDSIGSIKYPDGYTLTPMGEIDNTGVSGKQDPPTNELMGFDDGSYANAKDVMLSGESMQKVIVHDQQVTVTFSFTGTGFELISRTNAFDAATILVKVSPAGKNQWTWYPVITRFDPNSNGKAEVYQVPVFRLNQVAYGTYDVEVVGLPMQDFDSEGNPLSTKTSYIYIDGIRVYNPVIDEALTSNYDDEQNAKFDNLRDLILDGKGTLAAYTNSITGFTTGNYYYVEDSDNWFTAAYGGINELGAIGANNEIYIRRSTGNHILVLRVKEDTDGTGLLHIGLRDVHEPKFDGDDGENVGSSVSYNTTNGWVQLVNNTFSGTEQYYNIDLSNCPTDNGYKVVILRVDSGFVSFTNVKHKNITFGEIGEAALEIYKQPGFYFNRNGDMCTKDENGNEVVITSSSDLFNLNMINDIMAQEAHE